MWMKSQEHLTKKFKEITTRLQRQTDAFMNLKLKEYLLWVFMIL